MGTRGAIIKVKVLDVGCGKSPKGDVNVDFCREGINPQLGDQVGGQYVSPHAIKNLLVADAMRLPFKDKSFKGGSILDVTRGVL
jgi:hypothetical protein